jgi:hypothetical protein
VALYLYIYIYIYRIFQTIELSGKMVSRSRSHSKATTKRRSRSAKANPKRVDAAGAESVRVMTMNCRGYFDRYLQRVDLLKETMKSASPDVIGCQEVMVNGAGMDEDLAGERRRGCDPKCQLTRA